MDRKELNKNIPAITKEFNEILEKYGIQAKFTGGSVGEFEASVKFSLTSTDNNEAAKKEVAERIKREKTVNLYTNLFGINKVSADGRYEVVDYHSRKPKYPWIYIDNQTKKRFKCDDVAAKRIFGEKVKNVG